MRIEVVFTENIFAKLTSYFFSSLENDEKFAFVLCGIAKKGNLTKYLVNEIAFPDKDDIYDSGSFHLVVSPKFQEKVFKRSLITNRGILSIHSHPFQDYPNFSATDDKADISLANRVHNIFPNLFPIISVVWGKKGVNARYLLEDKFIEVNRAEVIGEKYIYNYIHHSEIGQQEFEGKIFDRQLDIVGVGKQSLLKRIKIMIVGVGGTGSIVAEQCVRLGIENFVLVDFDKVESSNLNRLLGAYSDDVGKNKTDVIKRQILRMNPKSKVEQIIKNIRKIEYEEFVDVDFIWGCVDSEAARERLNEISVRLLIPYFDIASGVFINFNKKNFKGQVRVIIPGVSPCLICNNGINLRVLENELLKDDLDNVREKAGYIVNDRSVPTPSVITLNSMVVSIAMLEFIKYFSNIKNFNSYILFDGNKQTVIPLETKRNKNCVVCGKLGVLAKGLGE